MVYHILGNHPNFFNVDWWIFHVPQVFKKDAKTRW